MPDPAPDPESDTESEPDPDPTTAQTQRPAPPQTAAPPQPPSRRRPIRFTAVAVIAVLTALLGFAIVVQVRQNSSTDNLANLREDDLVGILDNQNVRAERLRQQIAQLQQNLRRLQDSGDRSAAARQQAAADARTLGILLGTLPATGPGVVVTVADPRGALDADALLAIVEELRGAGAEAIEFGGVRISTSSAFQDITGNGDGQVALDGTALTAPYLVTAIGDAKTLDTALNIPGGVAAAVRTAGGDLTVAERTTVTITVTRALPQPSYASPTGS